MVLPVHSVMLAYANAVKTSHGAKSLFGMVDRFDPILVRMMGQSGTDPILRFFSIAFQFTTMLTFLAIFGQNSVAAAQYPEGPAALNAQNSNRERAINILRNLPNFSSFHFSNRELIAFFQFVPRCPTPALQYPVAHTGDFD
jgi:hypothetical protein